MDEEKDLAPLDALGKFLMAHLRDAAIQHYDYLAQGHWKAPSIQQLQRDVASLDERQRDIVRQCVINSLDSGIHDFLFNLVLESDNHGRVQMTVDGVNMAEVSDGLQGEPYGNRGWIATFSAFPD